MLVTAAYALGRLIHPQWSYVAWSLVLVGIGLVLWRVGQFARFRWVSPPVGLIVTVAVSSLGPSVLWLWWRAGGDGLEWGDWVVAAGATVLLAAVLLGVRAPLVNRITGSPDAGDEAREPARADVR